MIHGLSQTIVAQVELRQVTPTAPLRSQNRWSRRPARTPTLRPQ